MPLLYSRQSRGSTKRIAGGVLKAPAFAGVARPHGTGRLPRNSPRLEHKQDAKRSYLLNAAKDQQITADPSHNTPKPSMVRAIFPAEEGTEKSAKPSNSRFNLHDRLRSPNATIKHDPHCERIEENAASGDTYNRSDCCPHGYSPCPSQYPLWESNPCSRTENPKAESPPKGRAFLEESGKPAISARAAVRYRAGRHKSRRDPGGPRQATGRRRDALSPKRRLGSASCPRLW